MKKIKYIFLLYIWMLIPAIQLNAQTVSEYVYENNLAFYNSESDSPEVLDAYRATTFISDEIIAKTQEITKDCTTDMEKLEAVHDWVSTNIYYDHYGLEHRDYVVVANSVYEKGGSICEGFANLTAAMCRAAGIPCRAIEGWAYGDVNGEAEFSGNLYAYGGIAHAWNQAYVDGRWVILDTTWDGASKNSVNDKTVTYLPCRKDNFDISLQELSKTRAITSKPLDMSKHKLNIDVRDGEIVASWYKLFDIGNYILQYSTTENGPFEEYTMTFNAYNTTVNAKILSADTMYFRVMATEDGIVEVPSNTVAFSVPRYTVTFMDGTNVVFTQSVKIGSDAVAPQLQKEGYDLSWDGAYTNIKSDVIIKAVWTKKASETGESGKNKTKVSKPAKVTGLSVKNKKSKQLVIKWKKQKKADGYQIQTALKKNFKKGKKSKTAYKNQLIWKGLKKGKKYYVRVRAYTYDADYHKKYGTWSAVKEIKIKK